MDIPNETAVRRHLRLEVLRETRTQRRAGVKSDPQRHPKPRQKLAAALVKYVEEQQGKAQPPRK